MSCFLVVWKLVFDYMQVSSGLMVVYCAFLTSETCDVLINLVQLRYLYPTKIRGVWTHKDWRMCYEQFGSIRSRLKPLLSSRRRWDRQNRWNRSELVPTADLPLRFRMVPNGSGRLRRLRTVLSLHGHRLPRGSWWICCWSRYLATVPTRWPWPVHCW